MSVYRALLARPGARLLALASAAGWLSFGGLGLAIVLAVREGTGSFAAAGVAVGVFAGAAGTLAPLRARAVDRLGSRALLAFAAGHALALAALALGALTQAPSWVLAAAAAAAGALAPPLVAVARALWPRVAGPGLVRTGHALNALLGDAGAVLGPAIAGGLATTTGPELGLACLGAGAPLECLIAARLRAPAPGPRGPARLSGALGRALGSAPWPPPVCRSEPRSARSTWPLRPRPPPPAAPSWPRCRWRRSRRGAPSPRCGSARAGAPAAPGGVTWSASPLLATVLLGCLFVRSLPSLSALLLLAGTSYAALNVGLFELLDEVAPAGNAAESLAWITTAEGIGMAAGAAAAGALAGGSPAAVLAVVALAPLPGAAVGLARRRTLGPATPRRPTAARRSGP